MICSPAQVMQRTRDDFLACTGLSDDEHRYVTLGGTLDIDHQSPHHLRTTVQTGQHGARVDLEGYFLAVADFELGATELENTPRGRFTGDDADAMDACAV